MACYKPIRIKHVRQGPMPKVRSQSFGMDYSMTVPCGRCTGCRLERSKQWAVRCMNEAAMHESNSFVTLTYRDEELTYGFVRPTLYPRHLQLFMKRLRKEYGNGIRFFACGEYGERFNRPHYHACIFGLDFNDKKLDGAKAGNNYYHSDNLDRIWSHGRCIIGDVTFESAAYVARYIMDKKLGDAKGYYEQHGLEPEFIRMSRRPGIGAAWYEKYKQDVFPSDYQIVRGGIKVKPSRYYSDKYALTNQDDMIKIKAKRREAAERKYDDNIGARLKVHEKVKLAQIRNLKR